MQRVENSSSSLIFRKNLDFDENTAKNVRLKAKLTQLDLIEKFGFNKRDLNARNILSRYEAGTSTPANPPKGRVSKVYIQWLKENGYNPFNL